MTTLMHDMDTARILTQRMQPAERAGDRYVDPRRLRRDNFRRRGMGGMRPIRGRGGMFGPRYISPNTNNPYYNSGGYPNYHTNRPPFNSGSQNLSNRFYQPNAPYQNSQPRPWNSGGRSNNRGRGRSGGRMQNGRGGRTANARVYQASDQNQQNTSTQSSTMNSQQTHLTNTGRYSRPSNFNEATRNL